METAVHAGSTCPPLTQAWAWSRLHASKFVNGCGSFAPSDLATWAPTGTTHIPCDMTPAARSLLQARQRGHESQAGDHSRTAVLTQLLGYLETARVLRWARLQTQCRKVSAVRDYCLSAEQTPLASCQAFFCSPVAYLRSWQKLMCPVGFILLSGPHC